VLCIVTTGDRHYEDALQGRFGDRYFSAFTVVEWVHVGGLVFWGQVFTFAVWCS
jgi:hypothetical protein